MQLRSIFFQIAFIKSYSLRDFQQYQERAQIFIYFFILDLNEFSLKILFTIPYLLHCRLKHYETTWCATTHQGPSNNTKSAARCAMVWEILRWQSNKTKKQPSFLDWHQINPIKFLEKNAHGNGQSNFATFWVTNLS
jgi:hypothetical protein